MESYAGSSVCIKNAIFSKKNTKTGDFAMQKAVIFAERAKWKKFRTKIPDLGIFLYGIHCF